VMILSGTLATHRSTTSGGVGSTNVLVAFVLRTSHWCRHVSKIIAKCEEEAASGTCEET
jgi:hypothetical protein